MARLIIVMLLALVASACDTRPALLDTPLPDLTRADASVQSQVRARADALAAVRSRRGASDDEAGVAFGELAMLLHAAEFYDAAKPAYLNAQTLMPDDPRWPYYLALLHRSRGERAEAEAAFARVLELEPADVPALVGLARLRQDEGDVERAAALFQAAHERSPATAAILLGLGQSALSRKDYARAISLLEEALARDPTAASIHSPLAAAYRATGNAEKAAAHLRLWRNTDVTLPDPRREALDLALESGLSYELRGVRLMTERNFSAAADSFRRGVLITPASTALGRSLRHKLGTALFLLGDSAGAVREFEQTVALAPRDAADEPAAKAYYSLGVIMASTGRDDEAIAHFDDAVRYSPTYLEARIAYADALRRAGRFEASLPHYQEAVTINPRAAQARLGYAMALVRLRRYVEARDSLADSVRAQPDRPEMKHALARLYAAAPDAKARDGRQALALTQELFKTQPRTTALGETMAMTMAELGEFAEAVALQRGVLEAARRAGLATEVRRMMANLQRYEQGQACRIPWTEDDPLGAPDAPVVPGVPADAARP